MTSNSLPSNGSAGVDNRRLTRRCTTCGQTQSVDMFGNPHAPDICESCYRLIGVDIWEAGDDD